jgi:hypothetical protein
MSKAQQYDQLKIELNNCIKARENLNTFTITTFIAVLGLAFAYAENQAYLFLLAQIVMIPLLWRIINYKRTEYRLSKYIQDNFGDPWEKQRSKNNAFYFEICTLSLFIAWTITYFLRDTLHNITIFPLGCIIGSYVVFTVILFLSYKSSKLSTDNSKDSWCKLLFDYPKSK